MAEIAKKAKVSPATVSRVFNKSGYVSEETREQVLAIANEFGYVHRQNDKLTLSASESKKIGLIIPDIRNSYYTELINSIEAFMQPYGFSPIVCGTDEDSAKELSYLEVMKKINPAGIVLMPTMRAGIETVRLLERMESEGIPIVLLDRDIRAGHVDGVFMDNHSVAYQSTSAFLDCGHRNIAIVGGSKASSGAADRLQGYCDALADRGLNIQEEYILNGEFRFDTAYEVCRKLLIEHPEVTAILVTSRRMCSGCIFAMAELGYSIGKDIALICCGRPDVGSDYISHVANPADEMGMECGKLLLRKIENSSKKGSSRKRTFVDSSLSLLGSEVYPANR